MINPTSHTIFLLVNLAFSIALLTVGLLAYSLIRMFYRFVSKFVSAFGKSNRTSITSAARAILNNLALCLVSLTDSAIVVEALNTATSFFYSS